MIFSSSEARNPCSRPKKELRDEPRGVPCKVFTTRCYSLRAGPSGRQQRAEEIVVGGVHDIVAVGILPSAPAQITGIAGAKLSCAVFQFLKWTLERQRICYSVLVVVKSLACHIDDARRSSTSFSVCQCRNRRQQREDYNNEKYTQLSFHFFSYSFDFRTKGET